jgi:hypothetical protein
MVRRLERVTAPIVAVVLATLLAPGLVSAHSELVSSSPASGATVPSPYVGPIVLTFSEHLATGSKADLVDASGAIVASATVDATAMTMTFTLATPLPEGAYQVKWVSIADDGDVLRQPIVSFTVAAAAASPSATASAATSAAPSASATTSAAPTTAPTTAATPAPSPGSDNSGGGSDVVVPIIVALIVLGAGAAYLLTRRNRPTDAT